MSITTKEYYNGEHILIASLVKRGVRRVSIANAWKGKGYLAYSLDRDGMIGICLTDRPYATVGMLKSALIATLGDIEIGRDFN